MPVDKLRLQVTHHADDSVSVKVWAGGHHDMGLVCMPSMHRRTPAEVADAICAFAIKINYKIQKAFKMGPTIEMTDED